MVLFPGRVGWTAILLWNAQLAANTPIGPGPEGLWIPQAVCDLNKTSWKEWRTSEETTGLLFFLKGSFGAACQSSRLPTEQWQDNVGHLPFFEWSRELHVSLCSCISFTSLNPANQTIGKPTMPNPFPSMLACRHQDPSISNWIPT